MGHDERRLRVALLGCGYWGPNLLRSLVAEPRSDVACVVDARDARRSFVSTSFPAIPVAADVSSALDDPSVDAVVVATPAATHFELAAAALRAGKHVLVEKPLAMSVAECDELDRLATSAHRTLMVGHTFLFNPAVRALTDLVEKGELGSIHHVYSQRLNLGQVRTDVNALWNLAPHDFSILLHLRNGVLPATVAATGVSFIQPGIEDVVFATLEWADGVVAHVHVSWLDPSKVRRMTIVGSKKMVVFDDVSEHRLAVYDRGIDRPPMSGDEMHFDAATAPQLVTRSGDVHFPAVPADEPLRLEIAHFVTCALEGADPLTNAGSARAVVALLEAAQRSIASRGMPVDVAAQVS